MPRTSGFTLHELMVSVAVFTVFCGVVFGLAGQARREHDWATAYREDLRSCRSAMSALEADVRAGRRILPAGSSVVVRGPEGDVEYVHEGGELVRIDERGGRRTWSAVGGFSLTSEGLLARIVLEIRSRRRRAAQPGARLTTRVLLRNGGGR